MAAPVLIDTDPGIDDALALLMGWNSPEISVEAITTVAGNVSVEQGTVNVFRLLGLRKPTPRPVIAVGVDVPGNITPTAEFNMYADPEAAHRVLAARLPLFLVPLDATRQAVLPRAGLKSALRRESGPLVDRIVAFSERGFRLDHAGGAQGLLLHDPLALALAIDPTLAEWEPVHLVIGPEGETLRASGEPNCRIAKGVDPDRFLRLFLERLCPPAPRRPASS